jgi:hypothetical protein
MIYENLIYDMSILQLVSVVGSSIVKGAFLASKIRPDGINLGLKERQTNIVVEIMLGTHQ